jgi:hypothetical protein
MPWVDWRAATCLKKEIKYSCFIDQGDLIVKPLGIYSSSKNSELFAAILVKGVARCLSRQASPDAKDEERDSHRQIDTHGSVESHNYGKVFPDPPL